MLELIDISFIKDNKHILDNINLKLDNDNFYVITGPNGSGKSTLAKIIMGLEKPTTGKIIYNNVDITNLTITERSKLNIGFAFQQPVRFKGLKVIDLLEIAANTKLDNCKACDILSKVGLCAKNYLNREIDDSLSGGELKRIEIASIIAKNPDLAIFDEPEAGIDLWSFQDLTKLFKEMNHKLTIVISHQERILDIADKIILLTEGKIKQMGTKDEIMNLIFNKCCKGVSTYE